MDSDKPADGTIETGGPEKRAAPPPSYAPFMLALGVTMLFWGLATSSVMSAGGLTVFVLALWMWITEIAKGWRD